MVDEARKWMKNEIRASRIACLWRELPEVNLSLCTNSAELVNGRLRLLLFTFEWDDKQYNQFEVPVIDSSFVHFVAL